MRIHGDSSSYANNIFLQVSDFSASIPLLPLRGGSTIIQTLLQINVSLGKKMLFFSFR